MNDKIKEQRQKSRKPLLIRAEKMRTKVAESGYKQTFIAKQINVGESIFSRFMGGDERYVTDSIVDKLDKFFE